jgi:hypothetical protein
VKVGRTSANRAAKQIVEFHVDKGRTSLRPYRPEGVLLLAS